MPNNTDVVCTRCGRVLEPGHERCPIDGAPTKKRARMTSGRVLQGRYRLGPVLGKGGWATVYRARDLRDNTDVAVKVLAPTRRADFHSVKRFLDEARTLQHLNDLHVVAVRDCGQSGRSVFLVLELLPGRSLAEAIVRDAPFPPARAVRIALQICDGLGAAHDRGLVHRDLKPDNILLVQGGDAPYIKVADFGIARSFVDEPREQPGRLVGTPAYMSPEQARGEEADARSDLYALGLVLYEMLCGEPAFPLESPALTLMRRIQGPPPEIRQRFPEIVLPEGLGDALTRLLAMERHDRPRSAHEARTLLAPHAEQGGTSCADPAEAYDLPSTFAPLDLSPPLCGRDDETARLLPLVRGLGENEHATLLLIAGAGGVGKSRLAAALAEVAVAERGARRIAKECSSDGRELLQVIGELVADLDAAALTELLGDARSAEELLRILHPAPDENPAPKHDAAAQSDYHCQLVLDTLARCAARQPLVIVLDDAQAADSLTRAIVKRLPLWSRDRGKNLCFIVTWTTGAGPEPPAEVERERFADRARLARIEPLSDEASDGLLRKIGPLHADARVLIVRLCAGNPLHLFQLVRHLRYEKLLLPTRRGWRLSPRARYELSVPPVAETLAARQVEQIRSQQSAAADLLERIALCGDRVPLGVLRGLLEREGRADILAKIDALLDLLVAEGLLRRTDDAIVFCHALFREAVAGRIADPSHLHIVIAEAIAADGDAPENAHALALHLFRAGAPDRALPHALRSAIHARSRSDIPRASEDYLFALRCLDALPHADPHCRLEVELGLGETLLRQGQTRDAEEHFMKALAIADTAAAHEGLGRVAEVRGEYASAKDHLSQAEHLYLANDSPREAAEISIALGRVSERLGNLDEARERYQSALDRFTDISDSQGVARARMALGFLTVWTGDHTRGLALLDEALPILEAGRDPFFIGRCLCSMADIRAQIGQHAVAIDLFQRGLSHYERTGLLRGVSGALEGIGTNRAYLGAHEEAERMIQAALRLTEDMEDPFSIAACLVNLGFACRLAGKLEESAQWLQSALGHFRRLDARAGLAIARVELALTMLATGALDQAEAEFKSLLHNELRFLPARAQAECWKGLGDILVARDDRALARAYHLKAARLHRSARSPRGQTPKKRRRRGQNTRGKGKPKP